MYMCSLYSLRRSQWLFAGSMPQAKYTELLWSSNLYFNSGTILSTLDTLYCSVVDVYLCVYCTQALLMIARWMEDTELDSTTIVKHYKVIDLYVLNS